jgi:hypothetical protein
MRRQVHKDRETALSGLDGRLFEPSNSGFLWPRGRKGKSRLRKPLISKRTKMGDLFGRRNSPDPRLARPPESPSATDRRRWCGGREEKSPNLTREYR